jgi:acyl dehydratase
MTMMDKAMTPNYSVATAPAFVGRDLGVSDWVTIDQDRIDQFATCTGDRQWIHVDVERARIRQIDPALRVAGLKDLVPFRRPEDFARYVEGLRRAGLQD